MRLEYDLYKIQICYSVWNKDKFGKKPCINRLMFIIMTIHKTVRVKWIFMVSFLSWYAMNKFFDHGIKRNLTVSDRLSFKNYMFTSKKKPGCFNVHHVQPHDMKIGFLVSCRWNQRDCSLSLSLRLSVGQYVPNWFSDFLFIIILRIILKLAV